MSNTNQFLIPESIKDIVQRLLQATSTNERQNLSIQVEAIRDLCSKALDRANTPKKARVQTTANSRRGT